MLSMAEKKRSATYHIDEPLLKRLETLSKRFGVPKAQIVRLCVDVGVSKLEALADAGSNPLTAMGEFQASKETK